MTIPTSLLAMLCGSGLAFAQFTMTASRSGDQLTLTFAPDNQANTTAITGRPYSASLTSERTTPDGTRMIEPARRVYRDSQGRTRTEEQRSTIYPGAPFLAVELVDPVAGYAYLFDSENHVVHRLAIKMASRPAPRLKGTCTNMRMAATSTSPDGMVVVDEPLGERTIEGAIFCGSKSTRTYPAGSMFHNDRPVKVVNELWTAWDDGLPFTLHKNNWPGGQTSLSGIKDVSLTEPDPGLFRAPADYTIVEESGPFSVQLARSLQTSPGVLHLDALTDLPFSAEEVYEIRKTDPSGAVLTEHFSFFHYRDSMGRTVFGSMVADSAGQQTFRPAMITDPVAGYRYLFDQQGTMVHRQNLHATFKPASQAARPKQFGPDGWLGTQTINGFQTFGRRSTLKYAPGTLGGNDRQFVVVDESWTSPELGIALLTKRSHPDMGETTATIRNLTLAEPDAVLFRVSDGYRIVDDTESARK